MKLKAVEMCFKRKMQYISWTTRKTKWRRSHRRCRSSQRSSSCPQTNSRCPQRSCRLPQRRCGRSRKSCRSSHGSCSLLREAADVLRETVDVLREAVEQLFKIRICKSTFKCTVFLFCVILSEFQDNILAKRGFVSVKNCQNFGVLNFENKRK